MRIIAHRGASGECIENTIEAFERAYEQGADFIELDVQQTSDNFLVVYHDSHFSDGINVSDIPYKQFKERTEKLGISAPLLKDVLILLDGKVGINIEIKRLFDIDLLLSQSKNYPKDKVIYSSFDHTIITKLMKKDPKVLTGTLMVSRVIDPFPCMRALNSKILIQHFGFVTKDFVDIVHRNKCEIFVWTVNYVPDIHWFINLEVDGIFTDYPSKLRDILKEFK